MSEWNKTLNQLLYDVKTEGGIFRGFKRITSDKVYLYIGWQSHLSSIMISEKQDKMEILELIKNSKLKKQDIVA